MFGLHPLALGGGPGHRGPKLFGSLGDQGLCTFGGAPASASSRHP